EIRPCEALQVADVRGGERSRPAQLQPRLGVVRSCRDSGGRAELLRADDPPPRRLPDIDRAVSSDDLMTARGCLRLVLIVLLAVATSAAAFAQFGFGFREPYPPLPN